MTRRPHDCARCGCSRLLHDRKPTPRYGLCAPTVRPSCRCGKCPGFVAQQKTRGVLL